MQPQDIPPEHQAEFGSLIDQLSRLLPDIDNKLPMYFFALKSEDHLKRLIAIVCLIFNLDSFEFLIVLFFLLWHRSLL